MTSPTIVELAIKQRRFVTNECKTEEKERAHKRQQKLVRENARRVAHKKKLCEKKEKLLQTHLITSSDELKEELLAIDQEFLSAAKR